MSKLSDTFSELEQQAAAHQHVCVAYSGGKDSLAVAEMAHNTFARVSMVQMVFVPGLRYETERMEFAESRWGKPVATIIHHAAIASLQGGLYCFPGRLGYADWGVTNSFATMLAMTGASLLLTGQRKADYMLRIANSNRVKLPISNPISGWNQFDVKGYLKGQGIPLPDSSGKKTTAVDLSTPSLLWLHSSYPDDFARIERVFPFVRAVIKREEFYGKESWKRKGKSATS